MSPARQSLLWVALIALIILPFSFFASATRLPLRVVTTTTVFADLIEHVGGDRVEAISIVPAGVDPHVFDPTPREGRNVATADLLFINGLGLEEWIEKLLQNAGSPGLRVTTLSAGLTPIEGVSFSAHHHDEEGDPHFWLDVRHAMHYVRRIEQALSEYDPDGAAFYQANAAAYLAELEVLDNWIIDQISTISAENRVLVTYHDAFGYMAQRYGLDILGVLVRNPDSEPSPRELATLVREIRQLGAKAIFAEPQINPQFAHNLASESGIIIATLYSDALTKTVPTYIDMMRYNTNSLVEALR